MEKVSLKINGMHCEGCSGRLERILEGQDGVESATVSFNDKSAFVEYNESTITIERIKECILDAGFSAVEEP